jgi:general secretion pathway protein I
VAKGGHKGFTLIEVLVAMMILSIAVVIIMQLFSSSLRSARLADDYSRAVLLARQKTEETLLRQDLEAGTSEGEIDERFRWKAYITIKNDEEDPDAQKLPFQYAAIRIEIWWKQGQSDKMFQINTSKLIPRQEGVS